MWRKESKHKNALYVNICAANGSGKRLNDIYKDVRCEINAHKEMKILSAKCDGTSKIKRKYGVVSFRQRDWYEAIDLFNESLCFAENGSPCLGFAYANRSACFFNLKLYDKCLIDIDLAKKTNYPKHLMPELEKRRDSCLKHLKGGSPVEKNNYQLNFCADDRFPGLSSAVRIVKYANLQLAVAKEDMNVGQIIAIDKPFTTTLFTIYGWKCNICLKGNTNLVPCKKCTTAMFCPQCEDNNLHKYECGMKTSLYSNFNNYLMQELRTFFVALDLFSSAQEMMDFVEQTLAGERPDTLTDNRSKYKAFLKLGYHTTPAEDEQYAPIVFCVYKILLEIPMVQTMFVSKKQRRFLMHIVGQHFQINLRQTYVSIKEIPDQDGNIERRKLYAQVGVMLGFFHHSCAPNVLPIDRDGDTYYFAVRPIQAGEQLFISNYSFHKDLNGESRRHSDGIECHCERCQGLLPSIDQVEEIMSEPDFQFICAHNFDPEIVDSGMLDILEGKCVKMLNKHGRIIWCKQVGAVLQTYAGLLKAKLNGIIQRPQEEDKFNNNS